MNKQLDIAVGAKLTLEVTPEDINYAGAYRDCHQCILAIAAKRQFRAFEVKERGDQMKINGIDFSHKNFLLSHYNEAKKTLKPFSITLTRMYA